MYGFVAQMSCIPDSPFPKAHFSCGLCDRYAEHGVAVQDGSADLEFGDLTVEVACHEALPERFHAMHLRLDAASAVVAGPFRQLARPKYFEARSASFRAMVSIATRFKIIAIMISPLTLLLNGWRRTRWLMKRRRHLGVAAFFYALAHTVL